jgi:methionyl-tRNA formyltransferase
MVVVAYGLILPPEVLSIPKYGCMNVHASLLPKWRGAAPIQRAILSGDKITGVTIMQMDKGLDTGDMLLKRTCEINIRDTSEILHERLSILGAQALTEILSQLENKALNPEKQNDSESTYATKIQKTDAKINWQDTSENIHNLIRAFNPWPVAFTDFNGQAMRIWGAEIAEETLKAAPGTLVSINKTTLEIATKNGAIRIQEIQLPGGKRLKAADFINSHRHELIPMQTRFN